jgi:uncharacterized surface protein with fasciclin (FAS1) repeats
MRMPITLSALALVVAAVASGAVGLPEPAASARVAPKANIVETAVAAGQFKTLGKLLRSAGLARTLQARGPFTVFAPTDAAFAKVPKASLNALAQNRAQLRAVLLYHVAAGKSTARKVVKLDRVKTLNGATADVRVRRGSVFVAGAKVTTPDVMASNGVIHVINKVLLPPS